MTNESSESSSSALLTPLSHSPLLLLQPLPLLLFLWPLPLPLSPSLALTLAAALSLASLGQGPQQVEPTHTADDSTTGSRQEGQRAWHVSSPCVQRRMQHLWKVCEQDRCSEGRSHERASEQMGQLGVRGGTNKQAHIYKHTHTHTSDF